MHHIIGSISEPKPSTALDLPLPEEILDIVMSLLSYEDLKNLKEVGNERIEYCANKALKERCSK